MKIDIASYVSIALAIVGVLVVLTNIIVEVLKRLLWDRLPTNILAVGVAMVLTLAAFFAACSYCSITILWYYVVAAIILGFMVSYAAMFGFDKLKEILEKLGKSGVEK